MSSAAERIGPRLVRAGAPAADASPAKASPARSFRVLEPGGTTLTVARFVYDAGRLCFLETPSTRGRLAAYYFLDKRRQVVLEVDGIELRGTLATFWNGRERLWRLEPTG